MWHMCEPRGQKLFLGTNSEPGPAYVTTAGLVQFAESPCEEKHFRFFCFQIHEIHDGEWSLNCSITFLKNETFRKKKKTTGRPNKNRLCGHWKAKRVTEWSLPAVKQSDFDSSCTLMCSERSFTLHKCKLLVITEA